MADVPDLTQIADPAFEQHFLTAHDKLAIIVDAAGIRPDDDVVEVGAGAGTVARALPPCRSLTVLEFDERLIPVLRNAVPHATVIHGDAVTMLADLPCDVLVANLPNAVTEDLLPALSAMHFRVAVMAVGDSTDLSMLRAAFTTEIVATITGDDFEPPQRSTSRLVRLARRATQAL